MEKLWDEKLKYRVAGGENALSVLPNLLNLKSQEDINRAEFEGFLKSELLHLQGLSQDTFFDNKYISGIHKIALEHLYCFAGNYRSVNILKDDFMFPPARFLNENMEIFEKEILSLQDKIQTKEDLIKFVAISHAELLFIHPFREGNGRTARIFANMIVYKFGFGRLQFEKISGPEIFGEYVKAVQNASRRNYLKMEEIIKQIF